MYVSVQIDLINMTVRFPHIFGADRVLLLEKQTVRITYVL